MGTYTATGPFTSGTAPGISAAFLNAVETQLGIALTIDGAYTATAASPLKFVSIGGSDLTGWGANVSGDTQQRIAFYLRHTDNYGGLLGGAGSSITAHLYAQSTGWRITEGLTIDGTLTLGTTNGAVTTTQSGSANGIGFTVWNGSAGAVPFSIGTQVSSAKSWVDTNGQLNWSASQSVGATLNGSTDTGIYSLSTAVSVISGTTVWLKQNNYFNGTNDLFANNGTAQQLNVGNGGFLGFRISTASGTAGGTVTWNNFVKLFPTYLQSAGAFFGAKDSSGNKLFEGKSGGAFIITGAYQTAGGTSTIATAQTFDTFDYAECFAFDADYPNGTVVCLDDAGRMTRCTHDGCPSASIVSLHPGYMTGADDEDNGGEIVHPVALAGRVFARTGHPVANRVPVVSDGAGGVRALAKGRWGYALGISITANRGNEVGLLVRPQFCKGV